MLYESQFVKLKGKTNKVDSTNLTIQHGLINHTRFSFANLMKIVAISLELNLNVKFMKSAQSIETRKILIS